MFDLVIKQGRIVDGSGHPAFTANLGVKNGRIAAVGDLAGAEAGKVIKACGRIVSPGFVDIHTHSDVAPLHDPRAESQIRQGVTTEVIGQCGISLAPCAESTRKGIFFRLGFPDMGTWEGYGQFLEALDLVHNATNIVGMVGHGALREIAMGKAAPRPATDDEVSHMVRLLEESLQDGAFGVTTGLEYHPGKMASHDEVVAIAKVVTMADGLYATHSRNRDVRYLVGFGEALDAARQSGARLQISHINSKYGRPVHTMRNTLKMIDWAREEGLDVAMDMMPVNCNHTSAIALMPAWSYELDKDDFFALLKSRAGRKRLKVNPLPIWQLVVEEKWDMIRRPRARSEPQVKPLEAELERIKKALLAANIERDRSKEEAYKAMSGAEGPWH